MKHTNESMVLEATSVTPFVQLSKNGEIRIEGKALPEDSRQFFGPLYEWVNDNLISPEKIDIDMKLEYFNTAASKQIYEFLVLLKDKAGSGIIHVNWHYEEGDDDVLDTGTHYEALIDIPFNYIEFAEKL